MGSTWILVSARMASTRRPGKALAVLAGRPLLEVLLERMGTARDVDGVALITSRAPENDVLEALAGRMGVPVFRGDEEDVLRRHLEAARAFHAEHVVRVTGDNPLTDVETIEALVALHHARGADYTYVPGDALLMGILPEVISVRALQASWERGDARHRSELVTLYVKEHPEEFAVATATLPEALYRPRYRLTVDEPDDVVLMQEIFARLAGDGRPVSTRDAIALLDREPALLAINAHLSHKAANLRSVALDEKIPSR
ncbi:MAG TPA: NTP transferase domain-containing protein [Vicinamibacteria bacterium]|nr:NTP transferase domain-containing protein [Vicinamibacteria bacterium]